MRARWIRPTRIIYIVQYINIKIYYYYNIHAHIMRVRTRLWCFVIARRRPSGLKVPYPTTCICTPPRETQNVFYWFFFIIIIIIFYCIGIVWHFPVRRAATRGQYQRRGLAFRSDIMETRASYFHSIWHGTLLVIVP